MRVKKWITLLLSGAILAGSLAGCDRTVIEHQFHTDTVTDTEYIEIGGEVIDGFGKLQLQSLFLMHGIDACSYIKLTISADADEDFDSKDDLDKYAQYPAALPEPQIEAFEEGKGDIVYVIPCKGGEVDDFRLALSEGDKAICEQLKKDLDWDTFIQYVQNVNEKEGECYVYIRGHIVKLNDETHYAVIIMHTIPWL